MIPGQITDLVVHTSIGAADLWIATEGPTLRSRITLASVEELDLTPGKTVFALVKSASIDS